MFFTGEFARSIDEKLRVAIPKGLREALQCEAQPGIYVAPGTDRSLALYTEETFARLAERLAQASPTRQDVRAFNRLFYARAQRVELDGQGRLRIPPELAALAQQQGHYDEIAEAAFR
jgi:MraZ protein